MRLSDVGEAGLIAQLQRRLPLRAASGRRSVVLGIGDDAAVLEGLKPLAVVCADMLVEGVDFQWSWASPKDVGHKAAAVNLSDLAAMGAQPRGLLASVALQSEMRVGCVLDLLASLHRLGERFGAPLVGGDISRTSGPCVIAVTALGQTQPRLCTQRYRGQPGDIIAVTGSLGAAAAGLCQLQAGLAPTPSLVRRQLRPMPQLAIGQALARAGVLRAAADLSDGLIKDVAHVLGPNAGALIDVRALPIARYVGAVAATQQLCGWQMALSGGEDFELVMAIAKSAWPKAQAVAKRCQTKLCAVGRVTPKRGIVVQGGADMPIPLGFDHFR